VGDVDGHSSGTWYPDQWETSWGAIGVEPEMTTVTKRVRRVATFSLDQFYEACRANHPDIVFVSHMDYLSDKGQEDLRDMLTTARNNMGQEFFFLYGYGPHVSNIYPETQPMQGELFQRS
jgi:adenylosuccinate synthase